MSLATFIARLVMVAIWQQLRHDSIASDAYVVLAPAWEPHAACGPNRPETPPPQSDKEPA